MPIQQSWSQQLQQPNEHSFFSEPMQSNLVQQLDFDNQPAPLQQGSRLPQTFSNGAFPPAPMQSSHLSPQAFPNGSFSSTPLQQPPVLPQALGSGTFPPSAMQPNSLPPQTFANGPFPSMPMQFSPLSPQAFSNGSFPPIPLPSDVRLPQTFSNGTFPPAPLQSSPLPPQAFTNGPFSSVPLQQPPVLPQALSSGTFPNSPGGAMTFRAMAEPVQQHSPAGFVRNAGVIQQSKPSSLRRVLIAVGSGFIVALIAAVGYLALQQRPVAQQVTPPVKQVVQTHQQKLPTLTPITTSDPQALYKQATARPAISDDPLRAQSDNDWETVNSPGSCTFDASTLHAVNTTPDLRLTMCLGNATKYKNIAFQAQLIAIKGDTYGLIVRSDSKGHQLYLFSISTMGTYTLAVSNGQNGTQTHVLTAGVSTAIKQGQNQSNLLTIITRDNTLYLYINQRFVAKVDDTTTTTGSIGLFVGNSLGDVSEARFSNVKVWSV